MGKYELTDIEIQGFDSRDRGIERETTYLTGRLCVAQGMNPDSANTIGDKAARNSGELIFATLRRMGVIPEVGIDADLFKRTARSILQQSGINI